MILKRYGTRLHSVEPDFDSRALTEIGFRRDRRLSLGAEDFAEEYEAVETLELSASADGPVHDHAERELLRNLERELRRVEADAGEGVVVIESAQGVDYPKTRDRKQNQVRDGRNRLYFHWTVDPPLRVSVFRRRG